MDIATVLIAGYAAVLSTLLAIAEWRRRKPLLRVTLEEGFVIEDETGEATFHRPKKDFDDPPDWAPSERVLMLKAINRGERPVVLCYCAIEVKESGGYIEGGFRPERTLPLELMPGRRCQLWTSTTVLAWISAESGEVGQLTLTAEYGDATDKQYKSKPLVFDIAKHLPKEDQS